MRNLILIFIASICLASCSSDPVIPEGIIPDTTMSHILVQVTLIDAAYNVSLTDPNSIRFKPELFYETCLKKYGFTRIDFINSMDWYSQNTKLLLRVYDQALIELSEKQSALNQ
jgi:hypothetical protein